MFEISPRAAFATDPAMWPKSTRLTSRPLKGESPTVDLVLGYKKSNQSPILKLLLSRLDELVARASNKTR